MAEERGATLIEGVEARLERIERAIQDFRYDVQGRLARLESGFEQMDKRVSNLEQMQRWAFGLTVGTWITIMLAVLGLYFKR